MIFLDFVLMFAAVNNPSVHVSDFRHFLFEFRGSVLVSLDLFLLLGVDHCSCDLLVDATGSLPPSNSEIARLSPLSTPAVFNDPVRGVCVAVRLAIDAIPYHQHSMV